MKTWSFTTLIILLLLVLSLAGCAAPATTTTAPEPTAVIEPTAVPIPTEPPVEEVTTDLEPEAAVVQAMVERANAGDFAGAAELVSEDFKAYFLGMPPTGFEFYEGQATWQKFLEDCCTGQNFEWEVIPYVTPQGNVMSESKTWMDFTRELGVAPNDWHEFFMIEDGKISAYWSVITEDALAEFKPALCAALPEACPELVMTDTGDPVSEVTVTIENGTCAYDGPMVLQVGEVSVTSEVKDDTGEKYAVSFFTLEPDHDFVDLMASTYNAGPPSWSDMVFFDEVFPGETATKSFPAKEGYLYMVCWANPPGLPIGQAGPFEVRP
jgi:hypothetical protein